MTFNPIRNSLISTFACLILLSTIIFTATVRAESATDFIFKLRAHYQKAPKLEVFALNYHYLGRENPYQTWDYQSPVRYMALRLVEVDLKKKHFAENDIHHFSGGLTVNRVQFHNDKESVFYDKNGLSLGRSIINQGLDTFEEFKAQNFMNLDFLAVKPLLGEVNIATTIRLHQDKASEKTTLTHTVSDNNIIEYVFGENPLQLLSINNISLRKVYLYDDYQTTNGITFARSILKYYDGVTKPSFVHRIDQLHILDEIEPARFLVPKEFGPIITDSDRTLVSKEIAPALYLVTNAATSLNNLFKVDGDEITVFGGAVSPQRAEETINLILSQFPKHKINAIYVTHPHGDHIAGLLTYAKRGISIQADAYSIAAIKDYPPFADDIAQFKFKTIEHNQVIDNVQFYVLENSHSKRQSFAYFNDSGIVFQADFLRIAFDNTIPKVIPNYTTTFIDFVRSKELKINRIVSYHRNNNISLETMNKTYQAH
jgi:glyoxylase-like metal-dependent hydrolase (beta-lactamase superfamily II)